MAVTLQPGLKNPEVIKMLLEDDIEMDKIGAKLKFAPIAEFDYTLQGQPGDRVNVIAYNYIGEAVDGAENTRITVEALTQTEKISPKIKRVDKGTAVTDESVMTAYSNPIPELSRQITLAFKDRLDRDILDQLALAPLKVTSTTPVNAGAVTALPAITYYSLLQAQGLFCDEEDGKYTLYIHPNQKVDLLKQDTFEKANTLKDALLVDGYLGRIAGIDIVMSRRVRKKTVESKSYFENYIVKPGAVKVLAKKGVFVEPKREAEYKRTSFYADSHYVTWLQYGDRVVQCLFKTEFEAPVPAKIVMDGTIDDYQSNDSTAVKLPKLAQ